mmetsp:Transcript_3129/g.2777  ORF Transcript_3129/g.2777 Transcript_3129/m.2777 type:complete len:365 (-) Transcript_3129:36-1130(-)
MSAILVDLESLASSNKQSSIASHKQFRNIEKYNLKLAQVTTSSDCSEDINIPIEESYQSSELSVVDYIDDFNISINENDNLSVSSDGKSTVGRYQIIRKEIMNTCRELYYIINNYSISIDQKSFDYYHNNNKMLIVSEDQKLEYNQNKKLIEDAIKTDDFNYFYANIYSVIYLDKYFPLHLAIYNDKIEMVKYFIDNGFNNGQSSYVYNEHGRSALHLAVIYNKLEILKYLLAQVDDIYIKDKYGNNILHLALELAFDGDGDEIVSYLLSVDYNVNILNKCNRNALHLSVESNRLDILKLLIIRVCDIYAKDSDGNNILHIACEEGYYDIVKYLLSINYDINHLNNKKLNAKHYLAVNKHSHLL